jgi:hypothetical protein
MNEMSIEYGRNDNDRAKPKLSEKDLSPLSLFLHKSLTNWVGTEPGPVSIGFVTENVTIELHMTCVTVGHIREFEKFSRSTQMCIN